MPAATLVDQTRMRLSANRGNIAVVVLVLVVTTMACMALGYLGKLNCGGPPFFPDGRSRHWPVSRHEYLMPCYSDIQFLWVGRDINNHVFPFIHGGINDRGVLFGGAVEYPVLSGLLMYLGAIHAHTDIQFLTHSAILLAPFGLIVTILLGLMCRWRALLWAATPALILYAFHNWELPVVATAVAAVAVMVFGESTSPRTGDQRLPLYASAATASILLAIGFCLKLYPGLFVVPLAAYALTGGARRARQSWDIHGAAIVLGTAVVTTVIINLPFIIGGYSGWKASLTFQGKRKADLDTNSIWYWGLRHIIGSTNGTYNSFVGVASPVLILASFVFVVWLGFRVSRNGAAYPWVGVSAAMLAGFMLFHKVHSPQYTLWILPFFVLLRVRWFIVAAYLIADVILDLTIFRLFGIYSAHAPMKWWVITGVNVGVWVQAVLLLILLVEFVRTPPRFAMPASVSSSLPDYPITIAK